MSADSDSAAALSLEGGEDVSLLDILDHVLNSGVVIHGSIVISLAGVDLVYVGLNVLLTSVETALRNINRGPQPLPRTPRP
ncbi:MAG TPA: gas vesicle protein [Candidatus Binatia bacterium]|nr:gas vesicle protein [Candidatus Binatia bacterium]